MKAIGKSFGHEDRTTSQHPAQGVSWESSSDYAERWEVVRQLFITLFAKAW